MEGFAAKDLAHRSFLVGHQPLTLHIGHVIGHQPGYFALNIPVSQQVPHPGGLHHWPAVVHGLPGISLHFVQQAAAHRRIVDPRPLKVQQSHRHIPAPVFFAHRIGHRHPNVVENNLIELVAACHVDYGAHLDSGGFHIHQNKGDAAVLGSVRIGTGQQHNPVGAVGQGGPYLGAVDDVFIVVAYRPGTQGGQVGAGFRFAVALAPLHFAPSHRLQVGLLLFFGAVNHQRRPQHPHSKYVPAGRAHIGQFFVVDGRAHRGGVLTAVFFGPVHRKPALLRHFAAHIPGQFPVPLLGPAATALPIRGQLLLHKLAQLLAKRVVFGGKLKLHETPKIRGLIIGIVLNIGKPAGGPQPEKTGINAPGINNTLAMIIRVTGRTGRQLKHLSYGPTATQVTVRTTPVTV